MTKTKKQLRAEAVERLKDSQTNNLEWMLLGDECPNWVNYNTLSYEKAVRERVADLLTDDDANDYSTPEKVVSGSEPCVTPESCRQYADQRKQGDDADCESCDSREKLEADAFAYLQTAYITYPQIIELLDRQRAIDDSICDECSSDYYEMQEEHDQMIDGIAKLMRLKQPYTFDPGKPLENIETIGRYIDELQEQLSRTTSAMNRAAGKWARANEQCNEYREKFSKCLDYADAIHALMDDEGLA